MYIRLICASPPIKKKYINHYYNIDDTQNYSPNLDWSKT